MSWREGIDLALGLLDEPGTRLHAAVAGWRWPISRAEIWQQMLSVRVLNALLGKGDPPVRPEWPWDTAVEPVTFSDADRAQAARRLASVSSIPD